MSTTSHRKSSIAIISLSLASAALIAAVAVLAIQPAASSASPTPNPHPTSAPTPADAVTPAPNPTPICSVSSLSVTLGTPNGTAGSTVYPIVFTNTGSVPCDLQGYPGVSMVGDHNGTQIGAPATEVDTVPITQQVIKPGGSVQAMLQVEIAQNVAGCTPVAVDGLRVYPPHSYASVFVPAPQLVGCSQGNISLMSVQPVAAR
jgi:Protein of unknown function (DUF4232)